MKTCDTCAACPEKGACRALSDPNIPPSAKWLALEHLASKKPGSPYPPADCLAHREKTA